MRAHFTPQAETDLEEIGDHIALDNPERAVSFIREIRQHCEKIAEGPFHYVARPELGDVVRICVHGSYLIIFEPFVRVPLYCECSTVLETCLEFSTAPDPCNRRSSCRRAAAREALGRIGRIRDELAAAGVLLEDKPGGKTAWRRA